jgi:hypothetical protein
MSTRNLRLFYSLFSLSVIVLIVLQSDTIILEAPFFDSYLLVRRSPFSLQKSPFSLARLHFRCICVRWPVSDLFSLHGVTGWFSCCFVFSPLSYVVSFACDVPSLLIRSDGRLRWVRMRYDPLSRMSTMCSQRRSLDMGV